MRVRVYVHVYMCVHACTCMCACEISPFGKVLKAPKGGSLLKHQTLGLSSLLRPSMRSLHKYPCLYHHVSHLAQVLQECKHVRQGFLRA